MKKDGDRWYDHTIGAWFKHTVDGPVRIREPAHDGASRIPRSGIDTITLTPSPIERAVRVPFRVE